ncbi:ADP-ribosylglycohydrolase family protein [Lyngbya sp. CCY1209]|uniref:ADP-ribosylglycohydrolase family protein n=1 Tax=Lyngbya sp. CCY1209 TaxID=2886103 RepID=UPI002D20D872|nr:ADP-ribosylglycohydrolase family protein [Lyngbya sp. CCY1209]MEB3884769.1 ADP-ribosylglycohydrolase family protein [Lyngbya sp. CCY1209]
MDYPLSKRFQGALLGAILGGDLAERWLRPASPVSSGAECSGVESRDRPQSEPRNWQASVIALTESLIQNRRFDVARRRQILPTETSNPASAPTPGEAAIIALPVILLFHEDAAELRRQLGRLAELWPDAESGEREAAMLAMGAAIAEILRTPADTRHLLPSLLETLSPQTLLRRQLERVHLGLTQSATLAEMENRLPAPEDAALALGLYCFASTPLDPDLTLRRAARVRWQPGLTATLAAVLSGAHNGLSGIRAAGRLARDGDTHIDEGTLLGLAKTLADTWAGIEPSAGPSDFPNPVVTAVPQTF